MAQDFGPDARERPVGELFKQLATDTSTLVRQEIDLAKAEMSQKAKVAGPGVGMIVGAVIFALGAFGAFTAMLIMALDEAMPGWVAALIVFLLWVIVAVVLVQLGRKRIKQATPLAPEQTVDSLKEDAELARHPTQYEREPGGLR